MNSFIIVCQNDSFLTKKIHVSSVVLYWCSSLRDADWYFREISWNKAVSQPTPERCTLASTLLLLLLLLHPFNGLFSRTTRVSRHQKRKTSLDLNEARDDGVLRWQWHQLDHMQTVCTSIQTDNHTNTLSLNFYRPDALPDAQPTVSKHWRPVWPKGMHAMEINCCQLINTSREY